MADPGYSKGGGANKVRFASTLFIIYLTFVTVSHKKLSVIYTVGLKRAHHFDQMSEYRAALYIPVLGEREREIEYSMNEYD